MFDYPLNEYGLFGFMNIYALCKLQNAYFNVNFYCLLNESKIKEVAINEILLYAQQS